MKTGKILTGLAVAAAAGVIVGMLYAPAKGSVTRRRLARKGNGAVEEMNDSFNDFSEALSEGYESIKKSAVGVTEKEKVSSSTMGKHSK